jgi:hypothetical protein
VEVRVRVKGDRLVVCVRSSGRTVRAERDMDSLGIDLKSFASRFREGYGYSARWFANEVARLVRSKLLREIATMCAEAIVNTDSQPAVYPIRAEDDAVTSSLEEMAKEKVECAGYTVLRFDKSFAIKKYDTAIVFPYDVSKINPEKVSEAVYEIVKEIRRKWKLDDEVGGVMDYCMFLYESLGVR